MGKTREDNRQTQRVTSNLEVNFSDGRHMFTEFVRDMSTGGMQVDSPKPCEIGSQLSLSILTNPPLKIKGIVRWTRKDGLSYRIGVQFANLSREQQSRLREVIHALFWESYKA